MERADPVIFKSPMVHKDKKKEKKVTDLSGMSRYRDSNCEKGLFYFANVRAQHMQVRLSFTFSSGRPPSSKTFKFCQVEFIQTG